jgi:DNA-binding response OmpR family regulator
MSQTPEVQPVNHRTILVIEDSTTQALHLQALLEQVGLKVLLAHDGQEGLHMAQKSRPDLIVLDLEIPEMNGLQVCLRLKDVRETVSIPVIMFTRHDDYEVAVLGMQLGAIDYIPKDAFADRALLETLRRMEFIAPHTVPQRCQ